MSFDVNKETARVVRWTRDFLEGTEGKPLVIGMSGGKDSTITAAALAEAVGPNRILGVIMPNGRMDNIHQTRAICKFLEIQHIEVNILPMYNEMLRAIKGSAPNFKNTPFNEVVTTNAPCRCRTNMLYTIAGQLHGRVVNTCNLSESFVGYDTKFGDQCGDFGLFQDYTATEVKQMGLLLGVKAEYVDVPPADGMCGKTDEDRWGFSYQYLDAWLRRGGGCKNETDKTILEMHLRALHKIKATNVPHPHYDNDGLGYRLMMTDTACKELLEKYAKSGAAQ